jgi:hypothetical protein
VVVVAVLVGVAKRLKHESAGAPVNVNPKATELRIGDAIGEAVFEGVVEAPLPGFRLRLARCSGAVFILVVPLASGSAPQVLDQIYGHPPYRSTDVYGGQIREEFSQVSKWASYIAARVRASWSRKQTGQEEVFVRAYAPSDCNVGQVAYLEWADAVLRLGR